MACHYTARQESCHPHSNIETVADKFAGCGGTMSNHVDTYKALSLGSGRIWSDMVWGHRVALIPPWHYPISIELPWITIIDFRLYHQWFITNVMPLFTATQPGQDHKSSPDTPDTSCMSLQVALSLCLCAYLCIYVWRYVWMHVCSMYVSIRVSMYVCTYLSMYFCTFALVYCCTVLLYVRCIQVCCWL